MSPLMEELVHPGSDAAVSTTSATPSRTHNSHPHLFLVQVAISSLLVVWIMMAAIPRLLGPFVAWGVWRAWQLCTGQDRQLNTFVFDFIIVILYLVKHVNRRSFRTWGKGGGSKMLIIPWRPYFPLPTLMTGLPTGFDDDISG